MIAESSSGSGFESTRLEALIGEARTLHTEWEALVADLAHTPVAARDAIRTRLQSIVETQAVLEHEILQHLMHN
jgi:hypothetical protein